MTNDFSPVCCKNCVYSSNAKFDYSKVDMSDYDVLTEAPLLTICLYEGSVPLVFVPEQFFCSSGCWLLENGAPLSLSEAKSYIAKNNWTQDSFTTDAYGRLHRILR